MIEPYSLINSLNTDKAFRLENLLFTSYRDTYVLIKLSKNPIVDSQVIEYDEERGNLFHQSFALTGIKEIYQFTYHKAKKLHSISKTSAENLLKNIE